MSTMMNGLTGTKTDVILLCNIHKFKHRWASPLCQHTISDGWGKGEKSLCWLEPAAVHEHTTEMRRVKERWEKSINLKCREKHTASVRDDESKLQPAAQHKELSVAADEFDSRTRFYSSKDFGRCHSSTSFVESRHRRTPEFSTLRIK